MKKLIVTFLILTPLITGVTAASTGWSILDIFKNDQQKEGLAIIPHIAEKPIIDPGDDLAIIPHIAEKDGFGPYEPTDGLSCEHQVAENRALLLLIAQKLGISQATIDQTIQAARAEYIGNQADEQPDEAIPYETGCNEGDCPPYEECIDDCIAEQTTVETLDEEIGPIADNCLKSCEHLA